MNNTISVKTSELIGPALDWALAKCEGWNPGVLTIQEQAEQHEQVTRPMYSDTEWTKHLREWDKHVLPTLNPELVNVQANEFKDRNPIMINGRGYPFAFSTDWSQGGPIIERERLLVRPQPGNGWESWKHGADDPCFSTGQATLIAAMRCYVASKLGDTVDIPKELYVNKDSV